MNNILTNAKVAAGMSELELRARAGDPAAMEQLMKECWAFATVMAEDHQTHLDAHLRKENLKK